MKITDITDEELPAKTKAAHEACQRYQKSAVDHALKAGNMLVEARNRKLFRHGNEKSKDNTPSFKEYVEDRCGIPERTARRYETLVRHRKLWPDENESATLADLGVVGLERCINKELAKERLHQDAGDDPLSNDWEQKEEIESKELVGEWLARWWKMLGQLKRASVTEDDYRNTLTTVVLSCEEALAKRSNSGSDHGEHFEAVSTRPLHSEVHAAP
jgi:hypothetical protein